MQVLFGDLIEKGNNSHQVLLSYPYDQILHRDRRTRHKGRELGASCLMRFLPKVGYLRFKEDHFSDPDSQLSISNLKSEFKLGNLGDVIKPKIFEDPKYKMKKIVSHEELLENLEIVVQDKVFGPSQTKLLVFLGTSKEAFFNIFKAFCGFEHERIFSKLDDVDIERERDLRIRRKRRAREKRLRTMKSKQLISEKDYEEALRKVYLTAEEMKKELEEELRHKERDFQSQYTPIEPTTENLILVFDCFLNLNEYYNGENISCESINRRLLDYIGDNGLENTKVVLVGAHPNKMAPAEEQLIGAVNGRHKTTGAPESQADESLLNRFGEGQRLDVWTIDHLKQSAESLPSILEKYL